MPRLVIAVFVLLSFAPLQVSPAIAQTQPMVSPAQVIRHAPVASAAASSTSASSASGAAGWEQRYHPNHALGRAHLSTLAPMALGTVLMGIGERDPGRAPFQSPLYVTGLCLSALGVAVGPSTGLWCTGNTRTAWLSAGVRTAGLGAIGVGFWRASAALDDAEGLGVLVAAPFLITLYALPGLLITSAGAGWALRATPNRWCAGTPQARTTLQPHIDGTGQGLALRVTW